MMGRRAKTPEEKKIAGTYRKDRDFSLELPVEAPEAPEFLGEAERGWWKTVVGYLTKQGTIAKVDGVAVAMFCSALVEYIEADRDIKENGSYGRTDKGYEYLRPAVGVRSKAWDKILKMCRQFGMTAASRKAILQKSKSEQEEDLEDARNEAARGVR